MRNILSVVLIFIVLASAFAQSPQTIIVTNTVYTNLSPLARADLRQLENLHDNVSIWFTILGCAIGLLTLLTAIIGVFNLASYINFQKQATIILKNISDSAENQINGIKQHAIDELESLNNKFNEFEKQLSEYSNTLLKVQTLQNMTLSKESENNDDEKNVLKEIKQESDKFISRKTALPASVYNSRGLYFCINKKDYAEGIKQFDEAIRINPRYADAYNNRGHAYIDLKRFNRALTDVNKAIELKPDNLNAYYNRGNAYYALGQYDEALKDYNKAIELKPDFVNVYNNRGWYYVDVGNYNEAKNDFDKALSINKSYEDSLCGLALVNYLDGNEGEARKNFNKAIKINGIFDGKWKELRERYTYTDETFEKIKEMYYGLYPEKGNTPKGEGE